MNKALRTDQVTHRNLIGFAAMLSPNLDDAIPGKDLITRRLNLFRRLWPSSSAAVKCECSGVKISSASTFFSANKSCGESARDAFP